MQPNRGGVESVQKHQDRTINRAGTWSTSTALRHENPLAIGWVSRPQDVMVRKMRWIGRDIEPAKSKASRRTEGDRGAMAHKLRPKMCIQPREIKRRAPTRFGGGHGPNFSTISRVDGLTVATRRILHLARTRTRILHGSLKAYGLTVPRRDWPSSTCRRRSHSSA